MDRITNRSELRALADRLGVRSDWHEPDEQDITAEVKGVSFDNAGFWGDPERNLPPEIEEFHLIIKVDGEPVAAVNLATLCSWASEPEATPAPITSIPALRYVVRHTAPGRPGWVEEGRYSTLTAARMSARTLTLHYRQVELLDLATGKLVEP